MQRAIIITPKAFLYETITTENSCTYGSKITDELLSGWIVSVQEQQGNYLKVVTHYGYGGWLRQSDTREISPGECQLWQQIFQNSVPSFQEEFCLKPPASDNLPTAVIRRGMIDILEKPKVQSDILSTLFLGSPVLLCGYSTNGWQKVQTAEGSQGYVPSCALLYPEEREYTQAGVRFCAINYAKSYLGASYRWGGKTQMGIDCSGLTFMSYYMCGILIYRDAAIVEDYPVHEIPISQIKPADLLYFPGHIALYLGDGKYIHSTGNPNSFGCVINSLNPQDCDYRSDLAENIIAVGSVFL
ncbi:MAG: C40 family peptidase [Lachnospiraceae bacterium]|nr:C40 family peptidase [Lachnospiraceae bacterium]